jgi:ribosome-associated translation inhibitor RaiA
MLVQVNTDHTIAGHAKLNEDVEAMVRSVLDHLGDHLTRVEIHLSDVNGEKKGDGNDKRCMMEARLADHQPVAVTAQADSVMAAVDAAAEKLKRLLDSTLGRLASRA